MNYKGYEIRRGEIVTVRPGAGGRKGTYDVVDATGKEVHLVSYTVGNFAGRQHAITRAKAWIDRKEAES